MCASGQQPTSEREAAASSEIAKEPRGHTFEVEDLCTRSGKSPRARTSLQCAVHDVDSAAANEMKPPISDVLMFGLPLGALPRRFFCLRAGLVGIVECSALRPRARGTDVAVCSRCMCPFWLAGRLYLFEVSALVLWLSLSSVGPTRRSVTSPGSLRTPGVGCPRGGLPRDEQLPC